MVEAVNKPKVLDLYGCIGGFAKGLQRAGWHVTAVDIVAWPENCADEFIQADAIEYVREHGHAYDWIHGSPPCQGEGAPAKGTNKVRGNPHPRLIGLTRAALNEVGRPYTIENVAGSEVRKDVRLCGEMFGLGVIMHRYFELGGWSIPQPEHKPHRGRVRGWRHGQYYDGPYVAAYGKGGGKATVAEMQVAKGIDWSNDHFALREALPPAYGEFIGRAAMTALSKVVAA